MERNEKGRVVKYKDPLFATPVGNSASRQSPIEETIEDTFHLCWYVIKKQQATPNAVDFNNSNKTISGRFLHLFLALLLQR